MPNHSVAYIALGANLGDRAAGLFSAVSAISLSEHVQIVRLSGLFQTAAVGGPVGSPPFLNAAMKVHTTLGPVELMRRLLEIEQLLGRVRQERWGPRVIDLDLLLFGDTILQTPELVLPHPRMHERDFVLRPLAQIAPEVVHPACGLTVAKLLRALDSSSRDRHDH